MPRSESTQQPNDEQPPFPEYGAEVQCCTGSVSKVECVNGRGLFGWIVELSNGLFVEIKPNPEKESLIPWKEV